MTDKWTDQLSAYVDGELESVDREALDAHLVECDECVDHMLLFLEPHGPPDGKGVDFEAVVAWRAIQSRLRWDRWRLPAALAGVLVAAVLSAVMSTADSQLLVVGSSLSLDWGGSGSPRSARIALVVTGLVALVLALLLEPGIFNKVLFAWTALGAAFGPLLMVTLAKGRVESRFAFLSMSLGFASAVVLSFWDPSGEAMKRVLPFLIAGAIAWRGTRFRKNPE